jgi:hypothetical protein
MKTDRITEAAFFALLMSLFLLLSGCSTSKNLHQEKSKVEINSTIAEEIKTNKEIQTNTSTKTTSETQTTEQCDSLILVSVAVPNEYSKTDSTVYTQILVPIKFNRTIIRKEFKEQQQEQKEKGSTNAARKEQLSQKSETVLKDKIVERTGLPGWAIAIILAFILAGVAVLLWRLKVF